MSAKNYLATYAKSFNWAGFFLPKDTYRKCSALYDFCRVADNIADDENTITVKKEKFKKFKDNFENLGSKFQVLAFMIPGKKVWSWLSRSRPFKEVYFSYTAKEI